MSKVLWKPGNMLYPLPAVMVSCKSGEEKPNIITVAWAGTVCTSPAMLSVSIRPERYSYHLIKESGEFVVNLTTEELTKAMDYCGVKSGRDTDKFKEMNLTPLPSKTINAPGIMESPVNIECKVEEILELGSHHMFIARITGVQVDEERLDENDRLLLNEAGLVAYVHGQYRALGKSLGTFGYSVRKKKKNKSKKER